MLSKINLLESPGKNALLWYSDITTHTGEDFDKGFERIFSGKITDDSQFKFNNADAYAWFMMVWGPEGQLLPKLGKVKVFRPPGKDD